ncbi:hypothetical protein BDV10DRAFT_167995, partial [Aspergillus recurvatus]
MGAHVFERHPIVTSTVIHNDRLVVLLESIVRSTFLAVIVIISNFLIRTNRVLQECANNLNDPFEVDIYWKVGYRLCG